MMMIRLPSAAAVLAVLCLVAPAAPADAFVVVVLRPRATSGKAAVSKVANDGGKFGPRRFSKTKVVGLAASYLEEMEAASSSSLSEGGGGAIDWSTYRPPAAHAPPSSGGGYFVEEHDDEGRWKFETDVVPASATVTKADKYEMMKADVYGEESSIDNTQTVFFSAMAVPLVVFGLGAIQGLLGGGGGKSANEVPPSTMVAAPGQAPVVALRQQTETSSKAMAAAPKATGAQQPASLKINVEATEKAAGATSAPAAAFDPQEWLRSQRGALPDAADDDGVELEAIMDSGE